MRVEVDRRQHRPQGHDEQERPGDQAETDGIGPGVGAWGLGGDPSKRRSFVSEPEPQAASPTSSTMGTPARSGPARDRDSRAGRRAGSPPRGRRLPGRRPAPAAPAARASGRGQATGATSCPRRDRRGGDQRGGEDDRQPLRQVLDVAQLRAGRCRGATARTARPGHDLREGLEPGASSGGGSAPRFSTFGSGTTRNQTNQASSARTRIGEQGVPPRPALAPAPVLVGSKRRPDVPRGELLLADAAAARSWSGVPLATSRISSKSRRPDALDRLAFEDRAGVRGPCRRSSARTSACWSRP